jgi:hypothetical protein
MKNKEMVQNLLEQIEVVRNHYDATQGALYFMRTQRYGMDNNKLYPDELLHTLIATELDLWRSVFMFGMTLSDEDRDRIKAAAYDRFLNDNMSVRHYLPGGESAGMWFVKDEEEFRAMCKELFAPKEKKKS